MIEVYDSEVLKIEQTLRTLKERSATPRNYQHFENEILERFWDIGFRVSVAWWETDVDGVLMPDIEITERLEKEFDRDRAVHEIVNNVAEIPDAETGFIKTDPKEIEFLQSGQQDKKDKKSG